MIARTLTQEALALPEEERLRLVDELLASLHQPDPALDEVWAREAEARIAAFEEGRIKAIPAEEVFAELER